MGKNGNRKQRLIQVQQMNILAAGVLSAYTSSVEILKQ